MNNAVPSCTIQLRTMDHLARIAMKNAANCVKYGEMQGYRNRYMSNAYCGPVIHLTGPHLSEGLLNTTNISWLSHQSCGICPSIGIHPISSQFSRDESRALHGCFLLSTARLAPSSLNTDAALGDTTHLWCLSSPQVMRMGPCVLLGSLVSHAVLPRARSEF